LFNPNPNPNPKNLRKENPNPNPRNPRKELKPFVKTQEDIECCFERWHEKARKILYWFYVSVLLFYIITILFWYY
jgi:hypothetical protein